MTSHTPTAAARPRKEFQGPYDTANGADAYGHPVNGFGRCEQLNIDPAAVPPTCPNRPQRIAYLQTQPVESVVAMANALGVVIPPGLSGQALVDALAPLIATAEGILA